MMKIAFYVDLYVFDLQIVTLHNPNAVVENPSIFHSITAQTSATMRGTRLHKIKNTCCPIPETLNFYNHRSDYSIINY